MNSFVFPYSYVVSYLLKVCVADEKAVDYTEIDGMFVVHYYFERHEQGFRCNFHRHVFDLFPALAFQSPVIENSTDIVVEALEYRDMISD